MKHFLSSFLFFLFLFSFSLLHAEISLSIQIDRPKIYLGESFKATISVNGSDAESPQPTFSPSTPASIEFLGSSAQNRTSIISINGRTERNTFLGRIFSYRITPLEAGTFHTGPVSLSTPQGTISTPEKSVRVIQLESRNDIFATLSSDSSSAIIDAPFQLKLSIALRALPAPNQDFEPIYPTNPLHIQSDFLDFPERDGLNQPNPNDLLGPFVSASSGRNATFTINSYSRSPQFSSFFDVDPFHSSPLQFRFPPSSELVNGTNWWVYSLPLSFSSSVEGEFSFGPVQIKGSIITDVDRQGRPIMSEIYITTPALSIHVTPPPEEGRPSTFSGGIGRSLSIKTSLNTSSCKVGDPLPLTIELTGDVSAANLRPPTRALQNLASNLFRIYDDSVESESIPNGKRFRYRIRPLQAGTIEFPALQSAFYDTTQNAYITISSEPIPLQVEATTQIATSNSNESTDSPTDSPFIPNAILWSQFEPSLTSSVSSLPTPLSFLHPLFSFFASHLLFSIFSLPSLWLLLSFFRLVSSAIQRHAERTRYGRRAAAELRTFRSAMHLASKKPAVALPRAIRSARAFTAASFASPSQSLTASEMLRLFSQRGIDPSFASLYCSSFAALEEIPFKRNDDSPNNPNSSLPSLLSQLLSAMTALPDHLNARSSHPSSPKTLLIAFFLLLHAGILSAASPFATPPPAFSWERAQNAISSASTPNDFSQVASLYYSIATNGAASGPLLQNLGTALLLAQNPRAAATAFDLAASRLGETPDILYSRLSAEKMISGNNQLPPHHYFFFWHYRLSFPLRILFTIFSWNLFWISLLLLRTFPKSFTLRILSGFFFLLFLLFAGSIAITYFQSLSPIHISTLEFPPSPSSL